MYCTSTHVHTIKDINNNNKQQQQQQQQTTSCIRQYEGRCENDYSHPVLAGIIYLGLDGLESLQSASSFSMEMKRKESRQLFD